MKHPLLMILVLLFTSFSAQSFDPASAWRDPSRPYTYYESRAAGRDQEGFFARQTPLRSAKVYPLASLPKATSWKEEALQERFERIRDERFLPWKKRPNFPRRATWLYPDDGCYARAALAVRNTFRWMLPLPKKVFAFGNLRVQTPNSPKGHVTWWYHVAPIVEVGQVKYVLDPAIEPLNPLPLAEWLKRMGKPEKIKVAICGSGTYSPSDTCDKESDGMELRAERAQSTFLNLEWVRMTKLGRETELELGEEPPWEVKP